MTKGRKKIADAGGDDCDRFQSEAGEAVESATRGGGCHGTGEGSGFPDGCEDCWSLDQLSGDSAELSRVGHESPIFATGFKLTRDFLHQEHSLDRYELAWYELLEEHISSTGTEAG